MICFYICISEVPSFLNLTEQCAQQMPTRGRLRTVFSLGASSDFSQPTSAKTCLQGIWAQRAIQNRGGGEIYSLEWDKGGSEKAPSSQLPAFPLGLEWLSPPFPLGFAKLSCVLSKAKTLGFLAMSKLSKMYRNTPTPPTPLPEECVIQQTGSTCQSQEIP